LPYFPLEGVLMGLAGRWLRSGVLLSALLDRDHGHGDDHNDCTEPLLSREPLTGEMARADPEHRHEGDEGPCH
jgi:hypothetical protein